MQYAVISTGGKQYLAFPGKELILEKLSAEEGGTVVFDQVLLSVDGDAVKIGEPTVDGLTVTGTVMRQGKGEKIRVFKYKSKSRYRRTTGHRQHETIVRIDAIGPSKPTAKAAAASKSAKSEVDATKETKE